MARLRIKDHIRESRTFNERAAIALALVIIMIFVLLARLVYLQIISHEHFSTLAEDNRVSIVPIPPTRGLIYDRNGIILAQNLPAFSLEIVPERVSDMGQTVAAIGAIIEITDDHLKRFNKQLQQKSAFRSIPLRTHLNDVEVARFAANRHRFPGVEIEARLVRDYPYSHLTAHVIGYVGRINVKELKRVDAANYSATHHIGKLGIEKFYEDSLHGTVGFKNIETNVVGRTIRTLERTPPLPGRDLHLTLDIQLQHIADKALGNHRGAAIAIDPRNGEVLAMVSKPSYDPNPFVVGISSKSYRALQSDIDKPLFNRALRGQYPPGSTIKPFVGLAGLENNIVTTDTNIFCQGWFSLKGDDHKYRDWKKRGHGNATLEKAIIESCDVYFYDMSLRLGIDAMSDYLSHFGLGKKTGIDLPGELAGILPSSHWKRQKKGLPWYTGETLISGIGQGYNLTTPLQLASATATLATRGLHSRPHLVKIFGSRLNSALAPVAFEQEDRHQIATDEHWEYMVEAMVKSVHSIHGTARAISKGMSFKIAGKTGTAQVFGIKQDEKYVKEDIAERLRDHALFIAFAPADKPEIAIAVIVENGGSGGAVAAPVARKIIDQYMASKPSS
ncbi:MAG: penicillin-binding protein 2 [Thiotrichaceae bacterium]|nr:penicillin-binding protein 2 [Thiotrichaceae bacterium]